MKDIQNNLIDFLESAYKLTREGLRLAQEGSVDKLNEVLDNRERALNIVESLSEQLALHQTQMAPSQYEEFNNQVSQVINKIIDMDSIITDCLLHEKNKTQFEIAKTFKNKENFKGYNLNNLK